MKPTNLDKRIGRRGFLTRAAALGAAVPIAGGLVAAACADETEPASVANNPQASSTPTFTATTAPETATASGTPVPSGTAVPETPTPPDGLTDHDLKAEAIVKRFPEATEKTGGYVKDFTMDGDVKVFDFTIDEIEWELEKGVKKAAMGYDGVLPGPEIRVTEGDKVRINFKNNLRETTGIHFHGQYTPNNVDGVPYVTQPPIKPGETYSYEWTIKNTGTHMYHSHHNATDQVGRGLLGAFIAEPKDKSTLPKYDVEYTMIINDGLLGFTLNGKNFPATAPVVAKKGQTVLVRYLNEGISIHPMHLHGMAQQVIAIDGYPLANPYYTDTVACAPGNRYDVLIKAEEPGLWAFHCHVLPHVEGSDGMFGMVTVLIIQE